MQMNDSRIRDLITGLGNQSITATISFNRRPSAGAQASLVVRERHNSISSQESQSSASVDRSKQKKVHPKVRTGCDTCKRRKIKCDETKPYCLKCTKSGRQCEGYHPPQTKLFEPHNKSEHYESINEARSLEYYHKNTAIRMAAYRPLQLEDDFWFELCPRIAKELSPVKHALLALSATSEKYQAKYYRKASTEEIKERTVFALEQYTKALSELGSSIGDKSITAEGTLICSILLASCDIWHTGIPLTFEHAFAGLKICKTVENADTGSSTSNRRTTYGMRLLPAFVHLTSCADTIVDNLPSKDASIFDVAIPQHFEDLPAAFTVVDVIIRHIAQAPCPCPLKEAEQINTQLAALFNTLNNSLTLRQHIEDKVANFGFRCILVHHRVACIMLHTFDKHDEMVYDDYIDDFRFVVSELETLLTTYATDEKLQVEHVNCWQGVIPPLFYTATKCRDSSLRHRAINALHLAPHTERMWSTCSAAQIAKEAVWLEEHGIPRQVTSDDESSPRIHLYKISFDTERSNITLKYRRQNVQGPKFAESTLSWEKDVDIDAFHVPPIIAISPRYVRVAGYAPLLLTYRSIGCHCSGKSSATDHSVLLKSSLD